MLKKNEEATCENGSLGDGHDLGFAQNVFPAVSFVSGFDRLDDGALRSALRIDRVNHFAALGNRSGTRESHGSDFR